MDREGGAGGGALGGFRFGGGAGGLLGQPHAVVRCGEDGGPCGLLALDGE